MVNATKTSAAHEFNSMGICSLNVCSARFPLFAFPFPPVDTLSSFKRAHLSTNLQFPSTFFNLQLRDSIPLPIYTPQQDNFTMR